MSEALNPAGDPFHVPFVVVALASLVCASGTVSPMTAAAQQRAAAPDFAMDDKSAGHYEGGDTLVADTIAISTRTFIDNYRTPHTDQLHVIERYKLIDGGKMMEVAISVDDPGAFTTQWSAMQRFRRVPYEWSEDICADNNFDFLQYEVVPLPQAAKPDF